MGARLSITPAVAAKDRSLTHAEFRLLALFGCYANPKTGWCWPSISTLAKELGTKVRTTEKHIHRLVALGYIERRLKPGKTAGTKLLYHVGQGELPFDQAQVPSLSDGGVPSYNDGVVPSLSDGENVPMNDPMNDSPLGPPNGGAGKEVFPKPEKRRKRRAQPTSAEQIDELFRRREEEKSHEDPGPNQGHHDDGEDNQRSGAD